MKGYRISVLRHGMTDANENGIYIGTTDMPLSPKGASELAAKMDEYDYPSVHKVYSSPLRRCTETADILFPDTEMVTIGDLRELDFGEFEGKAALDLLKREDYRKWMKGGKDSRPPKGESLEEMTARTYSAIHTIIMDMMQNGLTHCAVITHAGIISQLMTCFGLPKYDPKYLTCAAGEGFEILVTAQMWLNSQAFEILGYCPYNKIVDGEESFDKRNLFKSNAPKNSLTEQMMRLNELCDEFRTNEPAVEKNFADWERKNGVKLPDSLKDWLRFSNGSNIDNGFLFTRSLPDFVTDSELVPEDMVVIGNIVNENKFIGFSRNTGKILWFEEDWSRTFDDFGQFLETVIEMMS